MSNIKQDLLELPRAVRETLEKGRPEYEALVRKIRWGDGPIYVMSGSGSEWLALTAAYAFEELMGWPVVARPAAVFQHYAYPLLGPRSVALVISLGRVDDNVVEAARGAQRRGTRLLLLADDTQHPLAPTAEALFLVHVGERLGTARLAALQHVALTYLATIAARVLKRPQPQVAALETEFHGLASHIEWAHTRLSDAVRSLASELKGTAGLRIVGGGFYHSAAVYAADCLGERSGLEARSREISEFRATELKKHDSVFFLSGSQCRLKKLVHEAVSSARIQGAGIFSLTDANDKELAERSAMALLLPRLQEIPGSALILAMFDWIAYHLACEKAQTLERPKERKANEDGAPHKNGGETKRRDS